LTSKVFSTFLAVSPRYWLVIIDIFTSTSGIPSSCASARETVVFPVPGGPTNSSFPISRSPMLARYSRCSIAFTIFCISPS